MSNTCGGNCGDNCACDHENDQHGDEMELETMFLSLDDDSEMECGILGVFSVEGIEGKEFIALLPLEDETVLLYEYKEVGEEVELDVIEEDELFDKVSATFYELFDDEEDEIEVVE